MEVLEARGILSPSGNLNGVERVDRPEVEVAPCPPRPCHPLAWASPLDQPADRTLTFFGISPHPSLGTCQKNLLSESQDGPAEQDSLLIAALKA